MRYAPHLYAESFLRAVEAHPGNEKEQVARLIALLEKNGDRGGAKKVLSAIERALVKKSGGRYVELESARPLSPSVREAFMKLLRKEDHLVIRTNTALVSGVRMVIDDSWAVDATLRARLQKLFSDRQN